MQQDIVKQHRKFLEYIQQLYKFICQYLNLMEQYDPNMLLFPRLYYDSNEPIRLTKRELPCTNEQNLKSSIFQIEDENQPDYSNQQFLCAIF